MKIQIPSVGMRTVKSAVAVMISLLPFLLVSELLPVAQGGLRGQLNPLYACLASIICMQGSVSETWSSGISRLVGIAVGGTLGTSLLVLEGVLGFQRFLIVPVLGAGIVVAIWACNFIHRPEACVMACVLVCAILVANVGPERYYFALARVLETVMGVVVALGVNGLLPQKIMQNEEEMDGK